MSCWRLPIRRSWCSPGAALWGLHMAATQGLLSKLVADTVPPDLVGTGFSGGALLLSSAIADYFWDALGPSVTFVAGAAFAAVAVLGIPIAVRHPAPRRPAG
jgi:hypothetical protein